MTDWLLAASWMVWLILMLVLLVIEMLTLDLMFLMLGVGALAAGVLSLVVDLPVAAEVVVFAVVSVGLLFLVRPHLLRRLHRSAGTAALTNADRLPGQPVTVLETVTGGSGLVRLDGDVWTARTRDGSRCEPGQQARVLRVDGATVVVTATPPAAA